MRPVLVADVLGLARVLAAVCPSDRPELARRMIEEAERADRYRLAFGTSHPYLGDGSVLARCLVTNPPPEAGPDDPDFIAAVATAALALSQRLCHQTDRMGLV